MKKRYTLCFLFNRTLTHILLIQKTKPEWQYGLLNGIGGKVEVGETFSQCAEREFQEETTLAIPFPEESLFGVIEDDELEIHCFCNVASDALFASYRSPTEETVMSVPIGDVSGVMAVHNLGWLIPMALRGVAVPIEERGIYRIEHVRKKHEDQVPE